jgi:hypothetical protein
VTPAEGYLRCFNGAASDAAVNGFNGHPLQSFTEKAGLGLSDRAQRNIETRSLHPPFTVPDRFGMADEVEFAQLGFQVDLLFGVP